MPAASWPAADRAAELYRRLRAGDPTATADFAAAYLDPLVAHLRATQRCPDDHLLNDAAVDALRSVMQNPGVYDPARGDLAAFLKMAANADLLNIFARERRHRSRYEDRDSVELEADDGNIPTDDNRPPSFDDPRLAAVIAALPETDCLVLDLMRAGERRTEAFAAVLGLTGRPPGEQACEVKRVKDRIKQRLKRAGGGA